MFAVADLLKPIAADNPCGDDLSFSTDFDAINEARRFDDPSIEQGEWVTSLKEADWPFVAKRCSELIATTSKDLRLAVWLAEANAKTRAFRGLGDGFTLIADLCDQYWDRLHPQPEDGDHERRIGNLSWLLANATRMIQTMPITEGKGSAYSSADFESARMRAAQADRLAAEGLAPEPGSKLADLEAARRKSSRSFYERLLADARYCADALRKLEQAVDARLGNDGPAFSATRDVLDDVNATIARYAKDAGVHAIPAAEDMDAARSPEHGAAADSPATDPGPAPAGGPPRTRAQALTQLQQVAEFFKRTEPHSPVAYLADKAVTWANMPLHQWLRTIVKDQGSLAHIEEMLGVKNEGRGE